MNFWQRTKIAGAFWLKGQSAPVAARRAAYGKTAGFKGFGGSSRNWANEAGRIEDNSAVSILLSTVANNFADAPFVVRRHKGDGSYEIVPDHAMAKLVKRPNPFWTRTQLFRAILTSLFVAGNCYIFKARNDLGEVVELWWLPHYAVTPLVDESGLVYQYKYRVGSKDEFYEVDEIVHLKLGIDSDAPHMGVSPLRAVLREICTDNEVLNYTYALLKNMGVPGVILSPKSVAKDDDYEIEIPKTLPAKIKALWRTLTGGDNRGEPLVLTEPWDVSYPGFKPSELMLDKVGELSEVRIAGAFGVPVVVVQFLAGLRNVNAKASYGEAIQQLYGCCIIPLQRLVCEWFDLQLLPDVGDVDSEHSFFDRSEVSALQENVNEVHTRADAGFQVGTLTRAEARGLKGFKSTPADDVYIFELQGGLGAVPLEADLPTPALDAATPPAPDGVPEAGVVTSQTLNGAQISAALAVVEQVRLGQIPTEVAVELLVAVTRRGYDGCNRSSTCARRAAGSRSH